METARAIVADPGRTPPPLPSPVRAPAVPSDLPALLGSAVDAVLVADRDGEVLMTNTAAADLFVEPPEALTGRDLDALVPGLEDAAASRTGHPSERSLELRARVAEDGLVPVEVRISWIETDEGRVLAAFLRPS
jgi:PAS domain-containing protein